MDFLTLDEIAVITRAPLSSVRAGSATAGCRRRALVGACSSGAQISTRSSPQRRCV
jgi:hypothetical protein